MGENKEYTKDLSLLGQGRATKYPTNPDEAKLETFDNSFPNDPYKVTFKSDEFTALCPITGQPDFATITIEYVPAMKCIESKSLKLYLFSYRGTGEFHEHVTNRILRDLVGACSPLAMRVVGDFNVRGGIGIKAVATYGNMTKALKKE